MSIIDDTPFLDDAPPADYLFDRVRQMRAAGVALDDAMKAAFAEAGKEYPREY